MNIETIKLILEQNSVLFLILFFLSLAANLFEITGFFRGRKKDREDKRQREKDEERLRIYEYLFETAEKSIKSGDELDDLQKEIARRENMIPALERRIDSLNLAAKKEIASQNISRTISEIRSSYAQLNKLQELNSTLGDLPSLPKSEKLSIEEIISKNTHKPYEFPKAITFRVILLVLVVLLLPPPTEQILVVVLLGMFLNTFFEVTSFSDEPKLKTWVFDHYRAIGFLTCFGAWYYLLRNIEFLMGRPINLLFDLASNSLRSSDMFDIGSHQYLEFFLRRSYTFSEIFLVVISIFFARIHWKKHSDNILKIIEKTKSANKSFNTDSENSPAAG